MTSSRALAVVAVAGVAIFALGFVNAWLVHDIEIRGEGYRHAEIMLSAWRSVAVPVLSVGVLAALATGAAAVARLRGIGAVPGWVLAGGTVVSLAIMASSVAPLGWDGDTVSIDLRPAWLTGVGIGLGLVMLGAVAVAVPLRRTGWVAIGVAAITIFVVAVGARQLVLTVSGPSNQNWSDGTYVSGASGPPLTLVIEDGRYRIGDRWRGSWEGTGGWTVALDDDPACPGSRGAYHAHGEGVDDVDLRFVMIVDTCGSGARAEVLESGIWERQP